MNCHRRCQGRSICRGPLVPACWSSSSVRDIQPTWSLRLLTWSWMLYNNMTINTFLKSTSVAVRCRLLSDAVYENDNLNLPLSETTCHFFIAQNKTKLRPFLKNPVFCLPNQFLFNQSCTLYTVHNMEMCQKKIGKKSLSVTTVKLFSKKNINVLLSYFLMLFCFLPLI